MYDDITCEYPLPDGIDASQTSFQTKSLDCTLTHYKITQYGSLLVHKWDDVPTGKFRVGRHYGLEKREAEKISHDSIGGGILSMVTAEHVRHNDRWDAVFFTGAIVFYSYVSRSSGDRWLEYEATFVDGRLQSIGPTSRHDP